MTWDRGHLSHPEGPEWGLGEGQRLAVARVRGRQYQCL